MPRVNAKACVFDVFGTVLDCDSSFVRMLTELASSLHIQVKVDWLDFAKEWRAGHLRRAIEIAHGAPGPTSTDVLHRELLDELLDLPRYRDILPELRPELVRREMCTMWHKLDPWKDAPAGLAELKKKVIIGPLSNGSTRSMIDLARHGSLPWDVIFSGDTFNSYKPARAMYEGSSRLLGLEMSDICMVAAHIYDLRAAREFGMKTVYVKRSTEDEGVRDAIRAGEGGDVDAVVESFEELAGLF